MPNWNLGSVGVLNPGGGLCGAFAAGFLEALEKAELPIDYFQGVSVGALTGAKYVADGCKAKEIRENFLLIEKLGARVLFNDSLTAIGWHFNSVGLFNEAGISALVFGRKDKNANIKGINAKALIKSPVYFEVGVHNESDEDEYERISNRDDKIKKNPELFLEFIAASGSPQGIFAPRTIGENVYSDGLYPKIKPPFERGCNTVFLILNDQPHIRKNVGREWWVERAQRSFEIMHSKEMVLAVQRARDCYPKLKVHSMGCALKMVKKFAGDQSQLGDKLQLDEDPVFCYDGQGRPLHQLLIVVAPSKKIGDLSRLKFGKGDITKALAHGLERGEEVFDKLAKLQAPLPEK